MIVTQFEVFVVNLDPTIGSEIKKTRPCVIISPDEIVHSSGYVHRDRLDEKGIFNLETREYTHKLFAIKRVSGLQAPSGQF